MTDLYSIARELRQRIELHRLSGWDLKAALGAPVPGIVSASTEAPAPEEPPPTSSATKEELLGALRREVEGCKSCQLAASRTQTVFGTGSAHARLLFVGEGPGVDEDRQGEPFVGKAGQLLNDIIRAMGLEREDVYIANIVKCRPPGNRNPLPEERFACRRYLERQIEIVNPEVVVALGAVAAQALLETTEPVGRLRGRFHTFREIPVMPTYHPAYLLRQSGERQVSEKRKTWEDVQQVMGRLGLRRPAPQPRSEPD